MVCVCVRVRFSQITACINLRAAMFSRNFCHDLLAAFLNRRQMALQQKANAQLLAAALITHIPLCLSDCYLCVASWLHVDRVVYNFGIKRSFARKFIFAINFDSAINV